MIDYQSVISSLLNGEASEYIPDGRAFSFPVATLDQYGAVIDNFFVYGTDPISGATSSPTAYIGVYSDTDKIAYYRETEDVSFPVKTSSCALSYEEYKHLTQEYQRLYPAVRDFAYSLFLLPEQRRLLLSYFDIQRHLFAGQMRYYRSIAPDFYHWMIQMLATDIAFLTLCEEGEADLDELPLYLDMAGNNVEDQKAILGMTQVEFDSWKALGDNIIRRIIHSRLMDEDFRTYQAMTKDQLRAARSYDPSAIDKIKHEEDT